MTLGFSQQIKGVNNRFVSKIWTGLMPKSLNNDLLSDILILYHMYSGDHLKKFGTNFEILDVKPKVHTIREGFGRWREGMDIHMVINNRTKNRFQFAPTIKCIRVQLIEFAYVNGLKQPYLKIDSKGLWPDNPEYQIIVEKLAINDGFDSVNDFFAYFYKDFSGTLIHWTDLRY